MFTLTFDASWWLALVFVVDLVVRVLAIIVVPRNRRPSSATAWLLAIYFIPLIGVFLFLLIGNPRLPRKRRRKQQRLNEYIHDTSSHLDFGTLRPHAPGVVHRTGDPQPQPRRHAPRGRQRGPSHPGLSGEPRRDGRRHPRGRALCARRVLHPPDGCLDRQLLPGARRGGGPRRHGPGAAGPLGQPRQAVLPQDIEAARRLGRALAPHAPGAAVQGRSISGPTCATTASCSSWMAPSPSWARRT